MLTVYDSRNVPKQYCVRVIHVAGKILKCKLVEWLSCSPLSCKFQFLYTCAFLLDGKDYGRWKSCVYSVYVLRYFSDAALV